MHKKIIYILVLFFFISSCTNTFDSVKRGITGQKKISAEEFLIKKKDPLVLPPDYENLPFPDEEIGATEEVLDFEKTLGTSIEESSSTSRTIEESILKKIRSK